MIAMQRDNCRKLCEPEVRPYTQEERVCNEHPF